MNIKQLLILVLTLSATSTFASLPQNESVCKKHFSNNLLQQQVMFSDRALTTSTRRKAERTIDHAREEFGKTQSYCHANDALERYAANDSKINSHQFKDGEVNYFGRSGVNFRFGNKSEE